MSDLARLADDVVARIDRDELIRLVLDICNIDSPVGHEAAVAERLYAWLDAEGFAPRRVGLLPERYNLLARLPGTGGGESLLFNGHMDTYAPAEPDLVHLDATRDELHKAWVEGDLLVGDGVVNDKGPIAAFLIAAKAIRASGVRLPGDLLLSAVVAETAHEPCDDAPGVVQDAKELGARFLATHGGIADHVLVAEGTGFGLVWVEAGKFWFKVTLRSAQPAFYTPYVPARGDEASSPNMIVAAAGAIRALERWAAAYEASHTYSCDGGTVVAKAQIGAIRSGDPTRPFLSPQVCQLFLDVRSLPGGDALATRDEIADVLRDEGLDATVELYVFRPGYEARNVGTLVDAVKNAHRAVFGSEPQPAPAATCSMWRDSNVFAELGIPAINYGPRSATHAYRRALTIESLYQAACVYARTAVAVCSRTKQRPR
jgi:acetylornithine deacetylase/succinyl-diaminopimelate desuccinylase-like protein